MICRECEKQIPDFIGRKMDYRKIKRFIDHVDTCENCREELVIQFLIQEGMVHLEVGDVFDLQGELQERMEEARIKVRINEGILRVGTLFETLVMAGILGIVVWILL
ncbi:MAG: zf-HC2 domain-containing protein [bacterium]|nr:zf-HC2 domain-containing protein [bacterium]MCM1375933.1 zf-HC2 domain-containing protein [Muribaculum sp.]